MAETFNKFKTSVSQSTNSISMMIAKHKTPFIILTTIIYIIILYLISKNDLTAHTGMYQGLYIFLAMLGFFLLGMIYLWGKHKDANYGKLGSPPPEASWTSMLKKALALVTFFGVSLGLILLCFWLFGNVPTLMNGIVVSLNFAIFSTQFSIAFLIWKFSSLMMVTVQGSTVLSPATLKIRPLNGMSICARFDAGNCAALHR